MKFISGLLITLFLHSLSLTAQRLPKTLLWRISGKDGHFTSYLYGTMHLTDDRVFNLGDSLYAAIAHTDGFAMELDPNDLTTLLVDEVKKTINNTTNLKDLLSEGEYKTYGPRLAKKLGKPLDKITSRDILKEKNKWVTDAYRNGKMPTFLDTYLYDVARRQAKWTGGVEDPNDQRNLMDDAIDESDIRFLLSDDPGSGHRSSAPSQLSSMIDVYVRQDLTALDSMENDLDHRDIILTKRNIKMAGRMDSLSGVRSMVFAVGAAHLPGDSGLINLLRKKGFDVEPVFSSRKIKASDYTVKELPRTWEKVLGEDSLYQVSMPGKPGDIELYGFINMKMYFDLFESIGYFSAAFQTMYDDAHADSLMDNWAKLVFKTPHRKTYTTVNTAGGKGRIYEVVDDDGYKKCLILMKDRILYLVFTVSIKQTEKNTEKGNAFVKSFQLLKNKPPAADTDALTFIPHIDTALAYQVSTPFPAKPYVYPGKTGWVNKTFLSADQQRGIYYFYGVNMAQPGRYIVNDSSQFYRLKKAAFAQVQDVIADTSWIWNGVRIDEWRARMQGDLEVDTRYIDRGNRWYALVALFPARLARSQIVDPFFSSFALMDYPGLRWQVVAAKDSLFSTWSPSPMEAEQSGAGSASRSGDSKDEWYHSYDSTRSMSYSVSDVHFKPYYWSLSDSAFWAARIKANVTYPDSLLTKRPVKNGDISGWEWVTTQRGTHLYTRRRQLLYGNDVYYLFASGLPEQMETENTNRFFDDFRFLHPAPPGTLFQPKAELLLNDLFSDDSATAASANSYLNSAPFTVKDLPLLHQTLLKWHSGSRWYHALVTRRIQELDDSSSFAFAAHMYPTVPDTAVEVKCDLLQLMTGVPDSTHFAALARLLHADPPAGALSSSLTYRLTRSLKQLSAFSADLLPLLNDSLVRPSLFLLITPMIDSGWLDIKALNPYRATLQQYASARIRQLSDPGNFIPGDKDLVELLGIWSDVGTNALLHRYLAIKSNYIRKYALEGLLRNKELPEAAGVRALAADKDYRIETYRELKKYGRIGLFPAEYQTPKSIAAALIYNESDDEDEGEVDSIVYVTSVIRDMGQGPRKFLIYRVVLPERAVLAVAGPFDAGAAPTAGWDPANVRAVILFDEVYDPSREAEQIKELVSKFKLQSSSALGP
jgi:uncharacterized protein YbaP (TraB family)